MSLATELSVGQLIWLKCEVDVWRPAEIISTDTKIIARICSNQEDFDKEETIEIPKTSEVYLRNQDSSSPRSSSSPISNDGGEFDVREYDDLTNLKHLHEPAVLHSLNVRYDLDMIYTLTGPILIAVNPFKNIEGIYNEECILDVINKRKKGITDPTPHVYKLADNAYKALCTNKTSQTILISGESGAGKTESTKHVMKYLACAGSEDITKRSLVENQVLQSNPLLEAFGNSKTLRNDNSSRFGKFIDMQFALNTNSNGDVDGRLGGARIHTYLLETVRICHQLEGERNYHSFYQACAASQSPHFENGVYKFPSVLKEDKKARFEPQSIGLKLCNSSFNFQYLCQSSVHELPRMNDIYEFEETVAAMLDIGISIEEIQMIWNNTFLVLNLGNLNFDDSKKEIASLTDNSKDLLKEISVILDVDLEVLEKAITNRTIKMQKEVYLKPLTSDQAEETRDALARALYNSMFKKIVQKTNESIGYDSNLDLSIGVLDIFGFECFDINSFEQLCINYTNERLQQFFNEFIFKNEEKLYTEENISWSALDFPDNQDCVNLLANPKGGIFSMLDEECLVPGGSDQGYCNKLKLKHQTNNRFDQIKTKQHWFIVNHFAGAVSYCSTGFLEKNKETLSDDIIDAIRSSKNDFFKELFTNFLMTGKESDNNDANNPKEKKTTKKVRMTVSLEFRNQLNNLMESIGSTDPHFIRCIKPNKVCKPDIFERDGVSEQLRYGGVLQAVQVSRAGFPIRISHHETMEEYSVLLPWDNAKQLREKFKNDPLNATQECMELLDDMLNFPVPQHADKGWAVGKTRVFFKNNVYDVLSKALMRLKVQAAVTIKCTYKMYKTRSIFLDARKYLTLIQCYVRQKLAEQEYYRLRDLKIAKTLQNYIRAKHEMNLFQEKIRSILYIQSFFRGNRTREHTRILMIEKAAKRVEAFILMKQLKMKLLREKSLTLLIQKIYLQQLAVEDLNQKKRDLRDVKKMAEKAALEQAAMAEKMAKQEAELKEKMLADQAALEAREAELEKERQRVIQDAEEQAKKLERENQRMQEMIKKMEEDAVQKAKDELLNNAVEQENNIQTPESINALDAEVKRLLNLVKEQEKTISTLQNDNLMLQSQLSNNTTSFSQKETASMKAFMSNCTTGAIQNENKTPITRRQSQVTNALSRIWTKIMQPTNDKEISGSSSFLRPSLHVSLDNGLVSGLLNDSEKHELKSKDSLLKCVHKIRDFRDVAITALTFGKSDSHLSEDYILLAAGGKDGMIVIYRCYKTDIEKLLDEKNNRNIDKCVNEQSVNGGNDENTSPIHSRFEIHCKLTGHSRAITSLFFTANEEQLVSTSFDNTVRFWDVSNGALNKVFTDASPSLVGTVFSWNNNVFLTSNSQAIVRVVNISTGAVKQKLKFESEIRALQFDDEGHILAAGAKNGYVHILETADAHSLTHTAKLRVSTSAVTSISYLPRIPEVSDCPQFAVSTNDDCISFLDINKNHHGDQIKVTFRFKVRVPQSKLPIQTCFSKFNGGWLFSGSENTNLIAIKIPDKTTKKETEPIEIKHHTAPVLTVAVNTRGTLLASADTKGDIALWRCVENNIDQNNG